ncbi:antirestriction protein ArdA [Micrococcus antarcticus]|uniref:antirestriction protein ArdA n=1 Tax=Micrococcus antarcticus TaxID=86171 RepID=UPI00384C0E36
MTAPRVWIGCLACYNAGRLVGHWCDAAGADAVTLADVHRSAGGARRDCEELWVMDHERLPVREEMDPTTAARWGALHEEVGEDRWDGFCAWVRSGAYEEDGDGLPAAGAFEDAYEGCWPSFEDYAYRLADDVGLQHGWSEEARTYFSWERWVRDLAFDYVVEDAAGGDVHVFRNG